MDKSAVSWDSLLLNIFASSLRYKHQVLSYIYKLFALFQSLYAFKTYINTT